MHIRIVSPVAGAYREVMARFDRSLFEALTPPGVGVKLIRFDGSRKGDKVHLQLMLLGFIRQDWISDIIEDHDTGTEAYFLDKGVKLPFFLSFWEHKHIVRAKGQKDSEIIDEITYKSPFFLLSLLVYPVLYVQFASRRPIYERYFGKSGV